MHKSANYEIVVSTENNPYVAWQAMLFHYSCMKHQRRAPVIAVHGDRRERLLHEFHVIKDHGGRIQRAPSFRNLRGFDYPPRNSAGTLLCVDTDADYVVLCDPDMLFVGPANFERLRLARDQVSLDEVGYLTVNDQIRTALSVACRRAGMALFGVATPRVRGGVPHIVPADVRLVLGYEWLMCMNYFVLCDARRQPERTISPIPWLTSMWALLLAVHGLGLRPVVTRFAVSNSRGNRPMAAPMADERCLIHYCYGDTVFNKRDFFGTPERCRRVWDVRSAGRSMSATICREIQAAARFYGLGRPSSH